MHHHAEGRDDLEPVLGPCEEGGGCFSFPLLPPYTAALPKFENQLNPEKTAVMKVDITLVLAVYSKSINMAQIFSEL